MNKEPSSSMSLKCVYVKDGGGLCIGHRGQPTWSIGWCEENMRTSVFIIVLAGVYFVLCIKVSVYVLWNKDILVHTGVHVPKIFCR